MPELPEVETVRATLEPLIQNATIIDLDVYWPKMMQEHPVETFKTLLVGQTIQRVSRRGKHLLFEFNHGVLISHLRMEGKYYLKPHGAEKKKHEHVHFKLADGRTLIYDDVRKFGTFHWRSYDALYQTKPLAHLALEPHDEGFNGDYLYANIHSRQQAIKTVLLDQTVVLGLGNIYVDEVLFCAGIHPQKKASKLSKKAAHRCAECAQKVIAKAVALGGSSIRSYTSTLGVTGRFQNELNVHTLEHQPCQACLTPIVKIKVGGRGTYFCPVCQTKRG
jgi:formamidopyrimidine-DNA glycosylase